MASLGELLGEIKQLLRTLSDRFEELAQDISSLESAAAQEAASAPSHSFLEESMLVADGDETQSLEPPPPDEGLESMEEETKTFDAEEPKTSEMKAVSDKTVRDETVVQKGEKQPLEPPPAKPGALPLLEKLTRLQEIVDKKEFEVSPRDFAFIPKSTKVYASLSDEESVGSKGARIVMDCLNFLDAINYKYVGDYYAPLRDAVGALMRSLASWLQREVGYRVFPVEEKVRAELEEIVPDYAGAVQEKLAYSGAPAGSIITVRRRGALLDRDIVRKAQLLVSCGEQSEAGSAFEAALEAVSSLRAQSERATEMKLKAMNSLAEWREKLYGSSEDHVTTMLRYTLNLLHTLENPNGIASMELFPGQAQKLKKVNERIVSLLRSSGLNEILVSLSGMFDESYDPSKYERKKVLSDKPEGTIVGVVRRGFLDKNGIPVQKAVVAVSGK